MLVIDPILYVNRFGSEALITGGMAASVFLHPLLGILCGTLFTLGLIGGGGSIIATPLLLYIVRLEPHTAIGTSAVAVSVNAFIGFAGHASPGIERSLVKAV